MSIVYEVENLKCIYKDRLALDVPNLGILSGSITGLIGPNGSGKSTLLRVLAFLQPYSGSIKFFGDSRRDVTLLLQEPFLLRRSVFENVAYGLKLRRADKLQIKQKVHDALSRVELSPEIFAQRPWHALSGGEAQRVALASRLALNPKVLLLDEPTANVDESSAGAISKVLAEFRMQGATIIIASHDLIWINELANQINDRILSLRGGKILNLT